MFDIGWQELFIVGLLTLIVENDQMNLRWWFTLPNVLPNSKTSMSSHWVK